MGNETEVKAKRAGNDHIVTIAYDFGENLDDAVNLFGHEVVFSKFRQASTVDLQSVIRRVMFIEVKDKDGNVSLAAVNSDEVAKTEDIVNWKPGVTARVTRTPKEKAMLALKGMSPAEIAQMLEELESDDEGKSEAAIPTPTEKRQKVKKAA